MALEAKNITVAAGKKVILQNLSFSLPVGKRTAVIGPNGAGKSTLLRALSGLQPVTAGQVLLDGTDLHAFSRKKLARQLAVLSQGLAAPTDVTVRQLVDYGRFPYRSWFRSGNHREDREAAAWALQATRLEALQTRQLTSLSGGERQRAWIAMALAQQLQYLLLDEPTTYLDIAHQLEVMQIIRELNLQSRMTILMVLHDINHVLQYADEVIVIKDKGIFAAGSPQKVLTVDLLAKVFGVQAEILHDGAGQAVIVPQRRLNT